MKFQKNREMTHQENLISAQIDGGLHEKQALLDDFAKAAMQGLLSNPEYNQMDWFGIAEYSYRAAEAMTQERERRMKG